MFTTADRAVMQLRLANLDQLAAHTPRPSAPGRQRGEHAAARDGPQQCARWSRSRRPADHAPELHEFLAEKLGHDEPAPEDLPTRARIEFAKHDAVHVSFVEDRLELVLNIRELGQGRDKIQNFQVHAYYRPHLDGLAVNVRPRRNAAVLLVRNLKTGARIVLHSVMGKVFSVAESCAWSENARSRSTVCRADGHATGDRRRLDGAGPRPHNGAITLAPGGRHH